MCVCIHINSFASSRTFRVLHFHSAEARLVFMIRGVVWCDAVRWGGLLVQWAEGSGRTKDLLVMQARFRDQFGCDDMTRVIPFVLVEKIRAAMRV